MLVNVLFASCMSVGGCIAVKASSVSCVNLSQSAFLWLVYNRLFSCIVCLLSVCIISNIGGGLSLVHGLSSRSFCCILRMIWW